MGYHFNKQTQFFDTDDQAHDLWLLFTNTRYAIFRTREKELLKYDLSPEQADILFLIQNTNATSASLSRYLLRQPQTVSSLVKRMQEKGLVQKVKDSKKKSIIRIVITEEGKKAYKLTTRRTPIHRIMATLNENEQTTLRDFLVKLYSKARKELKLYDDYWTRS